MFFIAFTQDSLLDLVIIKTFSSSLQAPPSGLKPTPREELSAELITGIRSAHAGHRVTSSIFLYI
ncbi:MAG: hypothetical protein RAK21_01655, partial [Synechococcus sp. SP2 MAG]|nr:hypothetical protein [Synechococcus sp. SP2 MAG]